MKCPIDGTDLALSERSGIEIDYCPKCRGIWLDRGELDKVIERAAQMETQSYGTRLPQTGYSEDAPYHDDDQYKPKNDSRYVQPENDPRKKRKSIFDDIFDIFD